MNKDGDDKLDAAVRRAFDDAPELVTDEGDDARIAGAVERALLAVDARPKPSFLRGRSLGYFAAAALCVAALAYAADHRSSRPSSTATTATATTATTSEPAREGAPPVARSSKEAPAPSSATSSAVSGSTAEGSTTTAITPDVLPSVPPPPKVVTRASAAPAPSAAAPPAAEAIGPAELFARANEARRANETRRAVGLYEELQTRFPDSREASTSRVALGRLLLDREGEPERARRLFDAYLGHDPSGALAEEARVGRALASLRLGDRQAERAAWLELLEHHPGSVHAERARQRLVVLGD